MIEDLGLLFLRAPAGNGQMNDPDDIESLDASLRRIGAYDPPPEYSNEPQRYATAPMIEALERFQEQNGLRLDGYANPGGPTERAVNNRLLGKPRGAGLLYDPPAPLAGPVGNGLENERRDVVGVQRRLGALDFLPENPFDQPHGFIDEPTTKAITRYQRDSGLTPDGWLAPGGETDRALDDAISDLARAKGREWLQFADRAGRAQTEILQPPSVRSNSASDSDSSPFDVVPAAWSGARTGEGPSERAPNDRRPGGDEGEPRVEPAQAGDLIVPPILWLLGALGAGAAAKRHIDESMRRRAEEGAGDGGKTEFIPPRTDAAPYRGTDPGKPPFDPRRTRPAPFPAEPPLKLPEREEIRPEQLKPEDWTLITPQISPWSASDLILRMRGNERTQGRLTRLREVGEDVARERTDVDLVHIGGTRASSGAKLKEYYAENPLREKLGIKTIAGSAFADLTFQDRGTKRLYHISLYRVSSGTKPLKEEVDQAIELAVNTQGETQLIVMVPNVRSDDFVDADAFKRFLHDTLDAIRGMPIFADMSDHAARDRVLRYFGQQKPK